MQSWIVPLGSAIAGGLMTSFIAPFIKWDIEKRRLRRQSRIDKIKFWRIEIEQHESFETFMKTQTYTELIPCFKNEETELFHAKWIGIYGKKEIHGDRIKMLKCHDLVSKLEKEWGII